MTSTSRKIAVYLNHPSHYYVFKKFIELIRGEGFVVKIFVKEKDILNEILEKENQDFKVIYSNKKSNSVLDLVFNVLGKNKVLYKELKKFKPNLMVSCGSDVAQVGFLMRIPSFVLNDDDAKIVPYSAYTGWPFAKNIFAPPSCDMGYWSKKTIFYKGYQKLFYLHPRYFKPEKSIVEKYISEDKPYFLIRSVSLTAHHDKNIRGLNNEVVESLIEKLTPHGQVCISSERALPESLEKYRLQINPLDMHHLISFANLIIGDSQSMAQEAALLGTPSIRFNDFVGRIGVMEELEHKYGLTFGISPDYPEELLQRAEDLATLRDKDFFRNKAQKMLDEMIDPTSMLVWFIENYPSSARIMKENPDYQHNFK